MTYRLLNTVVDSLYLRVGAHTRPSDWLEASMHEWRTLKTSLPLDADIPTVEIPGLGTFSLLMRGQRPYEFILANPEIADIRIINPQKWSDRHAFNTGQLYIAFRSRFMQLEGIPGCKEFIEKAKAAFMQPYRIDTFVKISRVDLAADIHMPSFFSWSDCDQFVSRCRFRETVVDQGSQIEKMLDLIRTPPMDNKGGANHKDSENVEIPRDLIRGVQSELEAIQRAIAPDGTLTRICHSRDPQTLYFGKMSSPLYARIYDKTEEIKVSGKTYMMDYWRAAGWDGTETVARVEFSLSGDFLKATLGVVDFDAGADSLADAVIDLRSLNAFVAAIPSIWSYLTHDWLKHCERGRKGQEWRWEVSELWKVVQGAWPDSVPIVRGRPERNPNRKQLIAQMKGVLLTTAAATSKRPGHEDTLDDVLVELVEYAYSEQARFDLGRRRRELGRDDLSDTWFSADVRRQMMLEGFGS